MATIIEGINDKNWKSETITITNNNATPFTTLDATKTYLVHIIFDAANDSKNTTSGVLVSKQMCNFPVNTLDGIKGTNIAGVGMLRLGNGGFSSMYLYETVNMTVYKTPTGTWNLTIYYKEIS